LEARSEVLGREAGSLAVRRWPGQVRAGWHEVPPGPGPGPARVSAARV